MAAELAKVRAFVGRLAPEPVCDSCIAARLDLAAGVHAQIRTRELAGSDGFERSMDACTLCGATTAALRKTR